MGRNVVGRPLDWVFHELSAFFDKNDDVHHTMRHVTECLRALDIPYAITGGMAMCLHGFMRVTGDVDLITTNEGLERIHARLTDLGLAVLFPGACKQLRDTTTDIPIKFVVASDYPGEGESNGIQFPDPSDSVELDGYTVLSLPRLIEGKIVTGTTVDYRQLQDLADVQALIRELRLPVS